MKICTSVFQFFFFHCDYNCDVICKVALARQSHQFYVEPTPSSKRGFHRKQSIILRREKNPADKNFQRDFFFVRPPPLFFKISTSFYHFHSVKRSCAFTQSTSSFLLITSSDLLTCPTLLLTIAYRCVAVKINIFVGIVQRLLSIYPVLQISFGLEL